MHISGADVAGPDVGCSRECPGCPPAPRAHHSRCMFRRPLLIPAVHRRIWESAWSIAYRVVDADPGGSSVNYDPLHAAKETRREHRRRCAP